ncbi:MAG: hypothetical protein WA861_04340 [Candidatus Binatus sp.]
MSETGTGNADALLSEIRSSRRLRSRRQDDKNCAKLSEIFLPLALLASSG